MGRATYRTLRPLTLSELRFDEEHRGWSFLFGPDEAAMLAELEQRAASSGPLVWRDGALTRDLYHWRLGSGQEVDFILEENRQLLPVEVKAADTVGANDARPVVTFRERHAQTPRGLLLSADPEIRVIRPGVIGCPWWAVL